MILKLGLYGTYISVIFVLAAINLPFAVITFSSYVKGIPREIDEAAIMDGCNSFQLIFKVLLPIMKPITITNLIIAAIGIWNNFQVPLYLMSSSERTTIPMMIFNFYGLYSRDWNYVFAALVITVLPVVILYLCLQKHIVEGMTSGAVKRLAELSIFKAIMYDIRGGIRREKDKISDKISFISYRNHDASYLWHCELGLPGCS